MTGSPAKARSHAYPTAADASLPTRPVVTAGALSARLQTLIGKESVSSFARRCGLAESVLRTYLKDGRMPPLDKALAIAAAAGVSIDWLATGIGMRVAAEGRAEYRAAMIGGAHAEALLLDAAVLKDIVETVLAAKGGNASPEQLAAQVVDLCQQAMNSQAATGW